MKITAVALLGGCMSAGFAALAQTDLPGVNVTAPPFSSQHGGYLVSGDFRVDSRMPWVVFPSRALVKGDILDIEPMSLQDNEYLVLQECASADCHEASIVRFWTADNLGGDDARYNRVRITHENKYFIWLKRLPEISGQSCGQGWLKFSNDSTRCGSHFTSFRQISPPMTLIPDGDLAAFHRQALQKAMESAPVRVMRQTHDGSTYVVRYEGGSVARIQRMHATRGNPQDPR
jgi:hypothetical protein